MIEYLFHGKDTTNGKWVEGNLFHDPDLDTYAIMGFDYTIGESGVEREEFWCSVIPESVGQYTGWTDSNGSKIFVGHILRCINTYQGKNTEHFCVVEFRPGGFALKYIGEDGCLGIWTRSAGMQLPSIVKLTIIGNVIDNLELLGTP